MKEYVYDTWMYTTGKQKKHKRKLQWIKQYTTKYQFTKETENNNRTNYLDITITKRKQQLEYTNNNNLQKTNNNNNNTI